MSLAPKPPSLRSFPRAIFLALLALPLTLPAQTPIPTAPLSSAVHDAGVQTPAERQPAASGVSQTLPPGTAILSPPVSVMPHALTSLRDTAAAIKSFQQGARFLDRKDLAAADTAFTRALTLDPSRPEYALAATVAREHRVTDLVQQAAKARLLGHDSQSDALLAQAHTLDPDNRIVSQHLDPGPLPRLFDAPRPAWSTDAPVLAGPITLKPKAGRQTFHSHADVQDVVRAVTSAFGLRPVFDDSVRSQALRFDLEQVPYSTAMPLLLQMAHLFAVPLDETSLLLARDTPDNRLRLQRQLQETLTVPGATPEQMSDLSNVIRNVFDVKQATVQNSTGSIAIRAPEDVIRAINLTLADLLDGGAQVMLDLTLYSVDLTRSSNIGATIPSQVGAYNAFTEARRLVLANQGIINQAIAQGLIKPGLSDIQLALALIASGLVQSPLLSSTLAFVGGGKTFTGIYTSGLPTINLALNSSESRALDTIQLRVGDRQPATFRAGSRYPITTSTFSSPSLPSSIPPGATINGVSVKSLLSRFAGSGSFAQIPQIQYEDLGLTVKATPYVQKSGQISLHLDFKIEALTGGVIDNIPILASRAFTSDVIVRDGDTAVLLSNLSRSEAAAVTGIPLLSEIPGLRGTPDKMTAKDTSQLVLLLTPHIIRRRSNVSLGPRIAVSLAPSTEP